MQIFELEGLIGKILETKLLAASFQQAMRPSDEGRALRQSNEFDVKEHAPFSWAANEGLVGVGSRAAGRHSDEE